MSTRLQRINPLLRRELSELIRSRYRDELAGVTVVDVSVSPDLRQARVVYSVIGDEPVAERASAFFSAHHEEMRRELGRRVVLKYLPQLRFVATDAVAEGSRILDVMDRLGLVHTGPVPEADLEADLEADPEADPEDSRQ